MSRTEFSAWSSGFLAFKKLVADLRRAEEGPAEPQKKEPDKKE